MLTGTVKQKFLNTMNSKLSYVSKKRHRKEIQVQAKKTSVCPNCKAMNGAVKKGVGLLKIVHDQLRNCPKKKKEEILNERIGKTNKIFGNITDIFNNCS